MIISVAVPVPLYRCFDYLPTKHPQTHQYQVGQRALVPFAGRHLVGVITKISDTPTNSTAKLKEIARLLEGTPTFESSIFSLLTWAAQYYCHPIGDCFHTALPTALRKTNSNENDLDKRITVIKWKRSDREFEGRKNATKQISILENIKKQEGGIWQEALKSMGYTLKQLRSLEDAGYLICEEFDPLTASSQEQANKQTKLITLNDAQKTAVEQLSTNTLSFQASLLQGVTGSGKTEVYIELVRQALEQGKQALILIPEINLTPQTLNRFQDQLYTPIGLIHSGMSTREKLTTWHLAKQGVAKVIIGTRSAIFTPFNKLGLIIVDEEHDASYKQIDGFKYSARDLAVKRAQLESCQVILGSATPSLESMLNATQGKYLHTKLTYRAGAGKAPKMHLIDIRSRPLENGCSRPLLERIDEEITLGNQVIIFQNRRGFSPTLICDACGWIAQCKHCDARITVHSNPPHMHCHHCNHKEVFPQHCESCQSTQLSALGAGTERIEFGLQARFPDTKIIRIDRDRIKKQADMKKLIEEINLGEPCLLVGTQMLAKGHDFHNVTLVAIIDADSSFFSADFRAIERSAQQLLQVAGRTGRGNKPGTVLIQTRQPEHPLFSPVLASDYNNIAKIELEERAACELPPYSKMVSLRAESPIQSDAFNALLHIRNSLSPLASPNTQISGPIEASMARKSGIFRCYLHIFFSDITLRSNFLGQLPALLSARQAKKVKITVDADPLDYI